MIPGDGAWLAWVSSSFLDEGDTQYEYRDCPEGQSVQFLDWAKATLEEACTALLLGGGTVHAYLSTGDPADDEFPRDICWEATIEILPAEFGLFRTRPMGPTWSIVEPTHEAREAN